MENQKQPLIIMDEYWGSIKDQMLMSRISKTKAAINATYKIMGNKIYVFSLLNRLVSEAIKQNPDIDLEVATEKSLNHAIIDIDAAVQEYKVMPNGYFIYPSSNKYTIQNYHIGATINKVFDTYDEALSAVKMIFKGNSITSEGDFEFQNQWFVRPAHLNIPKIKKHNLPQPSSCDIDHNKLASPILATAYDPRVSFISIEDICDLRRISVEKGKSVERVKNYIKEHEDQLINKLHQLDYSNINNDYAVKSLESVEDKSHVNSSQQRYGNLSNEALNGIEYEMADSISLYNFNQYLVTEYLAHLTYKSINPDYFMYALLTMSNVEDAIQQAIEWSEHQANIENAVHKISNIFHNVSHITDNLDTGHKIEADIFESYAEILRQSRKYNAPNLTLTQFS